MARRRRQAPGNASVTSGTAQYVKLEQRLVLLAWLNDLFGFQSNRVLLADMKEAAEDGFCRRTNNGTHLRAPSAAGDARMDICGTERFED